MIITELDENYNKKYNDFWRLGITQYSEFFRIHPNDHSNNSIPTKFTNDSFTLGAINNDKLIGIVSFERDEKIKFSHRALVFRMFVDPKHAGKGVGRALLNNLIDKAHTASDLRYIYLTVLATNTRAIHLYHSLHFKEFSRELGAVKIGGNYVDELQMALQLPNGH